MKLFKIVPKLFRFLSLAVYWLFITSGSLLNEYRILQMFLLCFEVIGNDDSLSLAVCTCCLGNHTYLLYFHVHFTVCWPVARQYCAYDVNLWSNLPLRIFGEEGAVSWETYLRVKTTKNWKEPVLRSN